MNETLRFTLLAIGCVGVFCVAGVLQTLWLKSPRFQKFTYPVDFGLHVRGKRLFGANKTFAGFLVMVPAVTLGFLALGHLLHLIAPDLLRQSGWPESAEGWFWLGLAAGSGYMLAELPNSFCKRQLDINPGESPDRPVPQTIALLVDQIDSILGAVLAIALIAPTHPVFWAVCILLGFACHWLFNLLLYKIGVKSRPA